MDIDKLHKLLERGPDGAMLRFSLGEACAQQRRWEEAAEHYREAVRFDADYSAAWQGLVKALLKAGADDDVIREACEQGLNAARARGDMQVVRVLEARQRRIDGKSRQRS